LPWLHVRWGRDGSVSYEASLAQLTGPANSSTHVDHPSSIFFEAFLSFVSLGIQVPDASLGSLISDGYRELRFHPYLLWFPAAILSLLMICFNLLGDGLRDALDPRMRR
jgi:oligopeptide transport system permease protein